jgi:hypothetical protein
MQGTDSRAGRLRGAVWRPSHDSRTGV